MIGDECKDCLYWKKVSPGLGECRRFPPLVVSPGEETTNWPMTGPKKGCGEHRENPIQPSPTPIPPPGG